MSKLGKFFKGGGSSKSRAAPSAQEALARLRETEEMLGKKQEYLEGRIQRELSLARKHGTQNKRAALQALKRKKRLEKQLTQIDGTLSTIEFQREALENSYTNTEVLKNMGLAAKAMKAVHENMDLNKIDDLMQEITEQQDIAQEISEAFSQRVGFGDDFDEDELMAELEELEQEELNKKMTNIRLPNAPSSSLPAQPDRGSGRMPGAPSARRSRAGLCLTPAPVVKRWPEIVARPISGGLSCRLPWRPSGSDSVLPPQEVGSIPGQGSEIPQALRGQEKQLSSNERAWASRWR